MADNDFDFSPPSSDDDLSDSKNVLDQLRAELQREIENDPIEIEVPKRPGVTVRFSPNFDQSDIRRWRRRSGENTKAGFDPTKFACYVVGDSCRAIFVNGVRVENEDGVALTFASSELLEMLDEDRPVPEGIQRFWVLDPHLEAAAFKIIEAAGWSDDVEVMEDPTKG